jgi:hypothetical protein
MRTPSQRCGDTPLHVAVPRVSSRSSTAAWNRIDADRLPPRWTDAVPLSSLLPIAIVAGSSAPILALVLAIAAPNKVAGFAVVKVMNAVNLLPVVAYSVPRALQFVAGIFPTYWPMRALWSAATRESYVEHLVIGAVISAFALLLAVWLFDRKLLRHG